MGIINSKTSCLCSDMPGRISTFEESHQDPHINQSCEMNESALCDQLSIPSPGKNLILKLSYNLTSHSPKSPSSTSTSFKSKIISNNASNPSQNIVPRIRNSKF